MAKKKMGLVDRLLLGKEKSEDYARNSLPSNRWELFWDIVKGRFWKLVIINILTILFFIPVFGVYFFKQVMLASYGTIIPYSQSFGIGYQALPSLVGIAETMNLTNTLFINLLYSVAFVFAGIGLAGGAYIIRNMVWTEGIFVSNDFWRGIKLNAKQLILFYLFLSFFFYISTVAIAMCEQMLVSDIEIKWVFIVCRIVSYLFLFFILFMAFHGTALCVTYDLKFTWLIKNSFLLTIGFIPQNIIFLICSFAGFLLFFLGTTFQAIIIMIFLLIGVSWAMLVWTDYSQWIFDSFINDKVAGAKKNRGIYQKTSSENQAKSLQKYREQLALSSRSSLSSKPIKPINDEEIVIAELPISFNRADIERLNQSKQAMIEDNERYIEEHKNDPEFQLTEEEIEQQKYLEEREKRIEKAKKELEKRNKTKK